MFEATFNIVVVEIIQGLNPLMFVFALIANVTYVARYSLSLFLSLWKIS